MRLDVGVGQWVGIAVVLGWCGLLGLVVPQLAQSAEAESASKTLAAGERITAGGVSMVPSDGWSQPSVDGLTLVQGEASLNVFAPTKATGQSATEVVAALVEQADGYTVGDPQPFSTESGLDGAEVLETGSEDLLLNFVVTDGTQQVVGLLTVSAAGWPAIKDDIDPMLESIEFGASTKGAS